ncbi:hypothetical protein P7K49_021911 [Saguinus oedipus]|uniref:Uncharacterized protein n=1 Tax=Saguinus oedipus TaxID=9490 RepID=A0ABQ9UTY2_SAGOE|nr:hypothetical protein P7K49_021911 [Saguinus oedipus]
MEPLCNGNLPTSMHTLDHLHGVSNRASLHYTGESQLTEVLQNLGKDQYPQQSLEQIGTRIAKVLEKKTSSKFSYLKELSTSSPTRKILSTEDSQWRSCTGHQGDSCGRRSGFAGTSARQLLEQRKKKSTCRPLDPGYIPKISSLSCLVPLGKPGRVGAVQAPSLGGLLSTMGSYQVHLVSPAPHECKTRLEQMEDLTMFLNVKSQHHVSVLLNPLLLTVIPSVPFNITINGKPLGHISFQLFADKVPKTEENFHSE